MRKLWAVLLISIWMLSACSGSTSSNGPETTIGEKVSVQGGQYTNVSVSELEDMLKDKDFIFINVHIPFEGDIPNTDLSIPYNEIEQNLDKLPEDKNARIVLYCRSDRMSTIASENLVNLGYTNIWNLEGGMVAWENAGLPIEGQ